MHRMMNLDRYTDLDAAVASEVRAEAARVGLSVSRLADRVGVRRHTLSARLNGPTPFRPSELSAVASALGVTASALVARAEAHLTTPSTDAADGVGVAK